MFETTKQIIAITSQLGKSCCGRPSQKGREDPSEECPCLKLGSTESNAADQIPVSGWAETFATRAVGWGHLELTLGLQVPYCTGITHVPSILFNGRCLRVLYWTSKTVVISPLLPRNLIATSNAISYMASIKSTFNEHGANTVPVWQEIEGHG